MVHTFIWEHQQSDGKYATIQLPLKIVKTVDSGKGIPTGHLICNDDNKELSQKYVCECGKSYSNGGEKILKRHDEDNDITYVYQEKKDFLKTKVDEDIHVMGEMDLIDLVTNQDYIKGDARELYSNENVTSIATVNKIHKWLYKHKKGLITNFGLDGKNRVGVIVPGDGKLLIVELRDGRFIRPPKQKSIGKIDNDIRVTFETISVDREPDLYAEYVEKLKAGVKIETKIEEKESEEIKLEGSSFLED